MLILLDTPFARFKLGPGKRRFMDHDRAYITAVSIRHLRIKLLTPHISYMLVNIIMSHWETTINLVRHFPLIAKKYGIM